MDASDSLRACTLQEAMSGTISTGGSLSIAHRAHDIAAREINLSGNECIVAVLSTGDYFQFVDVQFS